MSQGCRARTNLGGVEMLLPRRSWWWLWGCKGSKWTGTRGCEGGIQGAQGLIGALGGSRRLGLRDLNGMGDVRQSKFES